MLKTVVTWDKKTIAYDKSLGRKECRIYPDTVLWGMNVGGISNPTFETFLRELSKATTHPTPTPPDRMRRGLLGQIGQALIDLDTRITRSGGEK